MVIVLLVVVVVLVFALDPVLDFPGQEDVYAHENEHLHGNEKEHDRDRTALPPRDLDAIPLQGLPISLALRSRWLLSRLLAKYPGIAAATKIQNER